jgi:DNA-binding transcriptional LysR family regulator
LSTTARATTANTASTASTATLAARGSLPGPFDQIVLAVPEPPYAFRDAALRALDDAGLACRMAVTSANLEGLRAAVRAGIAVTVRTPNWCRDENVEAAQQRRIPRMSKAEFATSLRNTHDVNTSRMADLPADGMRKSRQMNGPGPY